MRPHLCCFASPTRVSDKPRRFHRNLVPSTINAGINPVSGASYKCFQILKGLRERYEIHHKLRYSDEARVAAAKLSFQYISDQFLLDKAIELIDEAGSKVRLRNAQLPEEARELKKGLRQIRTQKYETDPDKGKEMNKTETTKACDVGPVVTGVDIQHTVTSWTGIHVDKVSTDES